MRPWPSKRTKHNTGRVSSLRRPPSSILPRMPTSLFRSPEVDSIPLCAYVLPFNPHLLSLHRLLACTCMDRLFVSLAHFHALVFGSDLQCSLFFFSFSFSFLLLPWVSPLSSPPLVLRLSMRLDCYLFVRSMRFSFVCLVSCFRRAPSASLLLRPLPFLFTLSASWPCFFISLQPLCASCICELCWCEPRESAWAQVPWSCVPTRKK
jgi:hypothetical protein